MKYMIFETCLTGHRLEYIHHIYMGAVDRKDEYYSFILPEQFQDIKKNLVWPESNNICFRYISDNEIKKVELGNNLIKSSFLRTRLLKKYVKEENPDYILLITLMAYMPWLAFARLKSHSVRGIIYRIYLYDTISGLRKLINHAIYTLFSHRKSIDKVFILNDDNIAQKLNEIYHTSNFYFLPDPVPSINRMNVKNIRGELGIKTSDKMYLHFGGLTERKGTLAILETLVMMRNEDLEDKVFVFAGMVYDNIKKRFYALKKNLDQKVRILVYDEFCTYSMINNLCQSCDVILIPYLDTGQSSGVIGYASFFNKPVIGPSDGLVGSLIKVYNMGVTLDKISCETLKDSICDTLPVISNDYYKEHTVDAFISAMLS